MFVNQEYFCEGLSVAPLVLVESPTAPAQRRTERPADGVFALVGSQPNNFYGSYFMDKQIAVRRYQKADFLAWNAFVSKCKNGTFLFDRNFMEHHDSRFTDFSLVIQIGQRWQAILPANIVDEVLHSHQFLTYGGLVFQDGLKQIEAIEILKAILIFLESLNIKTLVLKLIPTIYHKKPANDLSYALWLANAKLMGRDCLKVVDLRQDFKISKTRQEAIRRGQKNELKIVEEANFEPFWTQVLTPNMLNRHGTKPIHSACEIQNLQVKFPESIRHFNVYLNDQIVAGTTIFVCDNVVHPQHISALENRSELGSIDFLYHHLLTNVFADYHYFDFGCSNLSLGKKLDKNLIYWKETYGSSTVVQDFYEVETKNHIFLNDYLI